MHFKSLYKNKHQSLKHKVNRCVLSLRINECKLSASRTAAGRLFHTTGPATENVLLPSLVLVRGTVYSQEEITLKVEMEYRLFWLLISVYIRIRIYFWRVCKISSLGFFTRSQAIASIADCTVSQ